MVAAWGHTMSMNWVCSTSTRTTCSRQRVCRATTLTSSPMSSASCPSLSAAAAVPSSSPRRCAVLGAGFAGLSVAWHLLSNSPKQEKLHVDIFDESGIGAGASGVSGGLIHPYSPKLKLLWRAEECWSECLNLIKVAECAPHFGSDAHHFIVRRTGILRPAVHEKNLDVMKINALNCLSSCRIKTIDGVAARELVPNLCTPLNTAFFMPEAVNVNPQTYLQALYLACRNLVTTVNSTGCQSKSIILHKKFVASLRDLEGEYDAVIVCLGAKVDMLPELSGILPIRRCRGIVALLQLNDVLCEEYPQHSPSILSDVWFAVQGPRSLCLGSTWEWGSKNFSSSVSLEEASTTLRDILPKACMVYPQIAKWTLTGARAGVRAMSPLTPDGSFPLLGCIDDLVGGSSSFKVWLIGGLGSRGLLYHGWLGKLTARAALSCREDIFPPELTSWRKMKRK
ncbi:hypothetical protein RND81_08G076900 [Saponaria officinalis]|uniref:FAD dependent oxidoreductase domain-containing protein n=2 Tax=Saponaria officinalis TaxID=3572 RepID=A0AAW1J5L4_SAPOF